MFFKLLSHLNHVENLLACEIGNRHKIMFFHFEFSFLSAKIHIISDLNAIIGKNFVILHSNFEERQEMKKIIVVSLWTLLALGIIASALGFTAIYNGWIGYMPPIEELQNPINRFATQVISADGKIMGTWNYNRENRIMVDYTQLSPSLVKALVAT
jgi:hypothetical protein